MSHSNVTCSVFLCVAVSIIENCDTTQHTATHGNTLQTHVNINVSVFDWGYTLIPKPCNILQRAATPYNTCVAVCRSVLQCTALNPRSQLMLLRLDLKTVLLCYLDSLFGNNGGEVQLGGNAHTGAIKFPYEIIVLAVNPRRFRRP